MFDRKALKAEARLRMKESQPRYWKVMLIWVLAGVLAPTLVTSLGTALAGGGSVDEYYMMAASGIDPTVLLSMFGKSILVALFLSIVVSFYQCVMNFGIVNYSLKLWRREECGGRTLFDGFTMVWRVIGTQVLIAVFVMLWALLFAIPVGIIAAVAIMMDNGFGIFLMVLAYIAYMVVLVIISLKYSLAMPALADEPELGALGAINRSKELMNGHKGAYFVLNLSFIGWVLLCSLLIGILSGLTGAGVLPMPAWLSSLLTVVAGLPVYLWLEPYMQISVAGFYDALCPKQPEIEPLNEYPEF